MQIFCLFCQKKKKNFFYFIYPLLQNTHISLSILCSLLFKWYFFTFFYYFTSTHGPPTLTHIYPFSFFSKHLPFLFSLFFFLFSSFSFFSQGRGSNQHQNKTHKILINQYHWWWEAQIWVAQVFISNLSLSLVKSQRFEVIPLFVEACIVRSLSFDFKCFVAIGFVFDFDFGFGLLVFSWWFNFELIFCGFWVD